MEGNTETGSLTLAALKKKKTKKGAVVSGKEETDATGNEELKALEAHMLSLSRQGMPQRFDAHRIPCMSLLKKMVDIGYQ